MVVDRSFLGFPEVGVMAISRRADLCACRARSSESDGERADVDSDADAPATFTAARKEFSLAIVMFK